MADRTLLLLSICFLFYKITFCKEQSCLQENPCLCRFNELQKIDLWPLANSTKNFYYSTASANANYFFRVCENYEGPKIECGLNITSNTTVYCKQPFSLCKCDTVKNVTTSFLVEDRFFVDTATGPFTEKLVYTPGQDNNVSMSVLLLCAEQSKSELYALTNKSDQLVLLSHYACAVAEVAGMSAGTTLLIIFFFFLVFYFVFGALLLRFLRGARGIEMIPNLGFWKGLPYLVWDGVIFLLSGCQPTALVTSQVYDRI